jgi:hypothetical protein
LRAYLARADNRKRAAHWNRAKPFFYVDCDMAAALIISVAQMVGFDVSLVEVPRHNFVRWQGEGGIRANWDWTNWASLSDERYATSFGVHPAQAAAGTYLQSQTLAESRGYYLSLIGRRARDPADRAKLTEEAAAAAPRNGTAAGNLAWMYATSPTSDRRQQQAAILHALAALSAMPNDAGRLETLACSYAAAGETALGVAVQEQAIRKAAESDADGYRFNRRNIGAGRRCGA